MRYFYGAADEQFPPEDLLKQAVEAERAGFDGVACSDHLQPWWEPGESGHAWVWLGAAGQAGDGGDAARASLPPRADRASLGDPGAPVPGTPISRHRFG